MKKTKYILITLTIIISIFTLNLSASAKEDTPPTTTQPTTTKSIFDDDKLNEEITKDELDNKTKNIIKRLSYKFTLVNSVLQNDNKEVRLNTAVITQTLNKIFLPLGYSLFFITWLLGISKKSMSLELYETQGMIKELALLIGGLIFMGFATYILDVINGISASIVSELIREQRNIGEDVTRQWFATKSNPNSKIPFVGFFINIWRYYSKLLYPLISSIILGIVALIISIIVIIRALKLAIYQGVAPLFFGFIGGENTKKYTQNFIIEYCLISFQLVFIAVVYTAFVTSYYTTVVNPFNETNNGIYFLRSSLLAIAYCFIILKSDKLFERVFR